MYFLKIYRFWEINHLLGVGGGPKVKNVKNDGFKNMHFCIKSTITRKPHIPKIRAQKGEHQ